MADLEARMFLRLRDLTGPGARSASRNLRVILKDARALQRVTNKLNRGLGKVRGVGGAGGRGGAADAGGITGRRQRRGGADIAISERQRGRDLRRQLANTAAAGDMVGRSLTRAGAVGRRSLRSIFEVAVDFEQSMAKVRSTVVGITETGFVKLNDKAKELGETTQFTASQVSDAMFFMGQAGLGTTEIIAGVGDVLNLAAAGSISLAKASDIATDVMAEFGLEAKDIGRITDVLVVGSQSATTNVTQLGQAMSKIGPLAKTLGVSLEEATAFTAAFANVGLKGGIGGRAFRRILLSLVNPSKKAKAAMKGLGIGPKEMVDASGELKRPIELFMQIAEAAKNMTGVERTRELAKVFASFGVGGAAEAAGQFAQSLDEVNDDGESVIDIMKILARAQDSQGKASEVAAQRMDTTHGSVLRLKSVLEGLSLKAADVDGLRKLIDSLVKGASAVGEWIDADPERAANAMKLFIVATAGASVMGPILVAMAGLTRLFLLLNGGKGIVAAAGAMKKLGRAGTGLGGIGIALAGIGVILSVADAAMQSLLQSSKDLLGFIEKSSAKTASMVDDQALIARMETLQTRVDRERASFQQLQGEIGLGSEILDFFGAGSLTKKSQVEGRANVIEGLEAELSALRAEQESRQGQDTKVGGTIKVVVENGQARVTGVDSVNPNVPIEVNTGLATAGV